MSEEPLGLKSEAHLNQLIAWARTIPGKERTEPFDPDRDLPRVQRLVEEWQRTRRIALTAHLEGDRLVLHDTPAGTVRGNEIELLDGRCIAIELEMAPTLI
jgi:hypothetical protein